jgi:hypothetical protein
MRVLAYGIPVDYADDIFALAKIRLSSRCIGFARLWSVCLGRCIFELQMKKIQWGWWRWMRHKVVHGSLVVLAICTDIGRNAWWHGTGYITARVLIQQSFFRQLLPRTYGFVIDFFGLPVFSMCCKCLIYLPFLLVLILRRATTPSMAMSTTWATILLTTYTHRWAMFVKTNRLPENRAEAKLRYLWFKILFIFQTICYLFNYLDLNYCCNLD